jgi:hypothetical protein
MGQVIEGIIAKGCSHKQPKVLSHAHAHNIASLSAALDVVEELAGLSLANASAQTSIR